MIDCISPVTNHPLLTEHFLWATYHVGYFLFLMSFPPPHRWSDDALVVDLESEEQKGQAAYPPRVTMLGGGGAGAGAGIQIQLQGLL